MPFLCLVPACFVWSVQTLYSTINVQAQFHTSLISPISHILKQLDYHSFRIRGVANANYCIIPLTPKPEASGQSCNTCKKFSPLLTRRPTSHCLYISACLISATPISSQPRPRYISNHLNSQIQMRSYICKG